MTKCPWFPEDVDPDPAALGLEVGEGGICLKCHLKYVVAQTSPSYRLVRDTLASAPTILALASAGTNPDQHRALLASKSVAKALSHLGVEKRHRQVRPPKTKSKP